MKQPKLKSGKAVRKRAGRIVLSEYQDYIVDCLKYHREALPYEQWLVQIWNRRTK